MDAEEKEQEPFQLHWEGPGNRRAIFEEDEDGGSYRGWLYLADWAGEGQLLTAAPVYTSPASRAVEMQAGASFIWDADGDGGVLNVDGRPVPLRLPASGVELNSTTS